MNAQRKMSAGNIKFGVITYRQSKTMAMNGITEEVSVERRKVGWRPSSKKLTSRH